MANQAPHCYCHIGRGVRNAPDVLPDKLSLASLARRIRVDAHAAWLCARDARTPWYARAFGLLVTAYALSPIDLIPDFIPVLGLLDDAILVPAGIWLFVRMVPPHVFEEHRAQAAAAAERPGSTWGAVIVVVVWVLAALLVARLFGFL
ncbi:MAG TPA: YkvA family protein [Allosphingosinicella sp.]|nr:YkvA family protein [Allosphingosinicella sp.]